MTYPHKTKKAMVPKCSSFANDHHCVKQLDSSFYSSCYINFVHSLGFNLELMG